MAPPVALESLNPREAVADAINRVVQAYDTYDLELFESGLCEDATFIVFGNSFEGREAIRTANFEHIGKMDTTHFVTNQRIHIEANGVEAQLTANALSQHYRTGEGMTPDAPHYFVGSRYEVDLVKESDDSGLWKVKKWILTPVWTQGDSSIMSH